MHVSLGLALIVFKTKHTFNGVFFSIMSLHIINKIESDIANIKEQNKNLNDYIYVITPEEHQVLGEYYGVSNPNHIIYSFMGIKMSVQK